MTELTPGSFEQFVRVNSFVVIHFWAKWNGYDAKMKEILRSQIPGELASRIGFGMLDTDPAEHHQICLQHQLRKVPSLAFYRDGLLLRVLTGLREAEQIIVLMRELVSRGLSNEPGSSAINICLRPGRKGR